MRYFFAVFLIIQSIVADSQHWNLKIDKDGIRVYNLKGDTAKFNEIKVECNFNTSPAKVVKLITDIEKQPLWVYGTKYSQLLKKVSETEFYFYKEVKVPAPMSNRDLVSHLKIARNNTDKSIKIHVSSEPNFIAEKKGLVRVPFSQERWNIIPLAENKVKIEYYIKIDPGGFVPPSLANLFSTKGPYESFIKLGSLLNNQQN
jgi:ribosome-associated toxin RatA of RatAB toxin-antitoxin module